MASDKTVTAQMSIQADQPRPISPDLFGIFFEDINYAADGGLYAELIQNRSFEYSAADNPDWNFFTAWELLQPRGKGSITLETEAPIHPNNPHYLVLTVEGEVGIRNTGFDGMVFKAGDSYNVSLFARVLEGTIGELRVRLERRTVKYLRRLSCPRKPENGKRLRRPFRLQPMNVTGVLSCWSMVPVRSRWM